VQECLELFLQGFVCSWLSFPAPTAACTLHSFSAPFAVQECLELFLQVLAEHYPSMYSVVGEGDARVVTMSFPDGSSKVYAVADFADCPLELCGRLVQVCGAQ
jgi:hypothetical protein